VETDEALDVFTLADEMGERGWYVQPQMAFRDLPATVHLTVSAATAGGVDDVLAALGDVGGGGRRRRAGARRPRPATAAAALDPATLDDAAFDGLLALAGLGGGGGEVVVPRRMAPVNALLDAAPPRLREALLVAFLDRLTAEAGSVGRLGCGVVAGTAGAPLHGGLAGGARRVHAPVLLGSGPPGPITSPSRCRCSASCARTRSGSQRR
jgi:hypothetical protein